MGNYKLIYAPKKVLILGNGFDLAHKLPTRYSDFLDFSSETIFRKEYDLKKYIQSWFLLNKVNVDDEKLLAEYYKKMTSIFNCIWGNIWYKYLRKVIKEVGKTSIKGENWIDFESEISFIIKTIDKHTQNITYLYSDVMSEKDNETTEFLDKIQLFNSLIKKYGQNDSVKEVRKILYDDLENLIQALEIYLSFVEKIPINVVSKDIADYYDYIISFNYTHTYQNVYGNCKCVFPIHGELNHKPNNMVLGIDEYWSEEERDSHTNFTIFKKFAQRIQKKTGIESYKWFEEIEKFYKNNQAVSEVHIFGHSLDITDKDILYNYLESEATSVTIYCKDKETEGEYIANVIKIIGEKRLLEKVNQYPPKLRFVIQQEMTPIEKGKKDLSTSGAAT